MSCHDTVKTLFNPIQDGGGKGGSKKAPYQFYPQNFLTFNFDPFATLA